MINNISFSEEIITSIKSIRQPPTLILETMNDITNNPIQLNIIINDNKDNKDINENEVYHNHIEYLKRLVQNLEQLRHFYISLDITRDTNTEIIKESSLKIQKIYYDVFYILIIINCLTVVTRFILETFDRLFSSMQIIYSLSIPYYIYQIYKKYQMIKILEEATKNALYIQIQETNLIKQRIKNIEETSLSVDNSNYYKTL